MYVQALRISRSCGQLICKQPDETTHVREFGSFDEEEDDTVTAPDDNQTAGPPANDSRGTASIWLYDPEASARMPGEKAGRTCL